LITREHLPQPAWLDAGKFRLVERRERVIGSVIGSAVGDALGAPFEFGPPNAFSARFPGSGGAASAEANEMCGGGGWEPGEATDDTQMAILVAESLLTQHGFDPHDMFTRFQRWARAEPKDIGLQTEAVLTSGLTWDRAAIAHAAGTDRTAGNGSLMRATTAAVYYARHDRATSRHAARAIAALTHADPAAGDGCAIYHDLIAAALAGQDPDTALPAALASVADQHRDTWATILDPRWRPEPGEPNGSVWPTLAAALWATRAATEFVEAVRLAIDLGGDTDTIAAVTGGLAGAVHGLHAVPDRWIKRLFVPLPGFARPYDGDDLHQLATRLDTEPQATQQTSTQP
jgi:ADP-ribosyl-[dinitrogen reductase] hydrolase